MSATPTSFTFDLDGVTYTASYRGITEGVGPRYTLFQCGQDIGLVWHCPDGWKTCRHSTAHPDIQGATRDRLTRGEDRE